MTPKELEEEIVSMLIEIDLAGDEKRRAVVAAIRAMMDQSEARRAAGLPKRTRGQNKENNPKSYDLASDAMQSVIDLLIDADAFYGNLSKEHQKRAIAAFQLHHGNGVDDRTAKKFITGAIDHLRKISREAGHGLYGPEPESDPIDDLDMFDPIDLDSTDKR